MITNVLSNDLFLRRLFDPYSLTFEASTPTFVKAFTEIVSIFVGNFRRLMIV